MHAVFTYYTSRLSLPVSRVCSEPPPPPTVDAVTANANVHIVFRLVSKSALGSRPIVVVVSILLKKGAGDWTEHRGKE